MCKKWTLLGFTPLYTAEGFVDIDDDEGNFKLLTERDLNW
jgi:hypothetical protein